MTKTYAEGINQMMLAFGMTLLSHKEFTIAHNCPNSLTSAVCKLMETVLKGAILNHLQHAAALSAAQHCFVPRYSCLTNLLVAEERITQLMDSGEGVDLDYLDFVKTFDSVNH